MNNFNSRKLPRHGNKSSILCNEMRPDNKKVLYFEAIQSDTLAESRQGKVRLGYIGIHVGHT